MLGTVLYIMEEKLQEILDKYEDKIARYEDELSTMESKIKFYTEHKLEEELRIIRIKYHQFDMAIFRWREMHKELKEMLNAWHS